MGCVEVVAASGETPLEFASHGLQRLAPGAGEVEQRGNGAVAILGGCGSLQHTVRERAVQRGDAVPVDCRGQGHGLSSTGRRERRIAALRSTVPTAPALDPVDNRHRHRANYVEFGQCPARGSSVPCSAEATPPDLRRRGAVMRAFVDTLLKTETAPVVTVTAALDRTRPGSGEDRIRFRNLLAEARAQIAALSDRAVAQQLADRLEDAATRVDLGGGAQGVVVVVTRESAEVRALPFPVRDGVSVGPTPATRYLVQGLRRSPRYRVLLISDRATRLFEAVRDELVEVVGHGFPMAARIVARDRRAVAGRFALPPGRDDKEGRRRFYRQVDQALTAASRGDEVPLVLVGVRRSTLRFREVSDNARLVVGTVGGAHDQASPGVLGKAVWPIMRARLKAQRAAVVAELAAAAATGSAVTGIDEVWQLGREGRGRLLVVEEDYRAQPAREVEGRLVWTDDAIPGVFDDPVDEIVEHVVCAGGTVEFVAPGALAELGRIGLILR